MSKDSFDKDKLKLFFYHTQDSGVGMWRMVHPAKWINKLGLAEVRMLPFYWRTHGFPNLKAYLKDCEDKGKQPSQEEFDKKVASVPKSPSVAEIEKLCLWADVIVVMRKDSRYHVATIQAMRELGKPVILETDDFVQYVPPYNPGAKYYRPGSEETDIWANAQFKFVDAVQVTTPGLKRLYRQLHPNITVLPNSIDPDFWIDSYPEPKPHPGEIWIGWTGANAHWGDLRRLYDAHKPDENVMNYILDKYPQVKFHFVGQLPDWWYGLKKDNRLVTHKFHTLPQYGKYLHSLNFDIGIAPLVDNLFNRGKSNIRWIEYSVNKAATVASPVWSYNWDAHGIMKNNHNVLFAKERKDWIKALSKLIEDETFRKKVAQQAYDDVLKHYNLETQAKQWVEFYRTELQKYNSKKLTST